MSTVYSQRGGTELSRNISPPKLRCGAAKIDIDVPKAFLLKHNIAIKDSSELHFSKHKDCFAVDNGDSYKLQIFAPFTSCGTVVEHGSDDYAYTNEVVFENEEKSLSVFQFRCIYEDKYIVSSGPISPTKRTLQFHSGEGEFEVAMNMYRGPSFSFMDKHGDNPTIRLNDPVYVDIAFTSNLGFADPGRDLVTSIKTCYATTTPDHTTQQEYHSLISGMCVSPEDKSVEILENGNSENARFKFNMFKWRGLIAYIYLHCEVHLCNRTVETCRNDEKMCHSREQRRKRRGITLPSGPDTEQLHRSKRQSQKYTIQADLSEFDDSKVAGIGESNIFYDLGEDSDNMNDYSSHHNSISHKDLEGMIGYEIPEEEEMTDFITRGPLIFDEDTPVGNGQINATITELQLSDDEFLRVYIFSSIAIVIFIIALILTILVALKRRKAGLEKLAGINNVFNGYGRQSIDGSLGNSTQHTDISQKASIITGISTFDTERPIDKPNILPAITGLPLPPTPELPLGPSGKLPPVLGSPITANSSLHEDSSASSDHNPSSTNHNNEIYHNITSDNKINTNKIPEVKNMKLQHHQSINLLSSNNNNNNTSSKNLQHIASGHNRQVLHISSSANPNSASSHNLNNSNNTHTRSHLNLHHHNSHNLHKNNPHHSKSPSNTHRHNHNNNKHLNNSSSVHNSSSNNNHNNTQRLHNNLQKAESSRLHTRPNLQVNAHNSKVERSKTSCHPSNHPSLYNTSNNNKRKNGGHVENNTVSHTLSNYSN